MRPGAFVGHWGPAAGGEILVVAHHEVPEAGETLTFWIRGDLGAAVTSLETRASLGDQDSRQF